MPPHALLCSISPLPLSLSGIKHPQLASCASVTSTRRRRGNQTVADGHPSHQSSRVLRTEQRFISRHKLLHGVIGPTFFGASLLSAYPALSAEGTIARIRIEETPDQSAYDPTDENLVRAARTLKSALNAPTVEKEEQLWTELIEKYEGLEPNWVPDIVGRAYGNRGNARSRQGKFGPALADYEKAVELCPWSVDPVLNRGVLYENTGQLDLAERDYRSVLLANPQDPVGWNNLGNVQLGVGKYADALDSLERAVRLSPEFAFAAANHSLAQFELGETNKAIKEMRNILRRYPDFPESRAALVAALWSEGLEVQAETEWQRVSDPRYKDKSWLQSERRWPPKISAAFNAFLSLKSMK